MLHIQFEEGSNQNGAYTEERQINPEDPSPSDILCEAATCGD